MRHDAMGKITQTNMEKRLITQRKEKLQNEKESPRRGEVRRWQRRMNSKKRENTGAGGRRRNKIS
jgi:hypothetical protein